MDIIGSLSYNKKDMYVSYTWVFLWWWKIILLSIFLFSICNFDMLDSWYFDNFGFIIFGFYFNLRTDDFTHPWPTSNSKMFRLTRREVSFHLQHNKNNHHHQNRDRHTSRQTEKQTDKRRIVVGKKNRRQKRANIVGIVRNTERTRKR